MTSNAMSSLAVARLAAAAALETPGVVGLHGGAVGELATYGDGRRVRGVRVQDRPAPRLRLHLIVAFGVGLEAVAEDVRARIRAALRTEAPQFASGVIDVHVADVTEHAASVQPAEEPVRWR